MKLPTPPDPAAPPEPSSLFGQLRARLLDDALLDGAAVLGYYLTLAIFPGVIFVMALLPYLPVADLDGVIVGVLRDALPGDAASMFTDVVREITAQPRGGLLSVALLGALWAASNGMRAVMGQLNVGRGVRETRGFVRTRATAVGLSVLFGVLVVGAASLVVLGDWLQRWLSERHDLAAWLPAAFAVLRWVIAVGALVLAFGLIYRWGPATKRHRGWLTPGAAAGVALLVTASLAFRLYVNHFGDYSATYGSIGAVIVLMLWLYIAGLAILIGAAIDGVLDARRRAAVAAAVLASAAPPAQR